MNLTMLLLSALLLAIPARAGELVFVVSTGSAMPMTNFDKEVLTTGLLKDFGDALANELGMQARYLSMPRKRVEPALVAGQGDLLCDLRPEWMESTSLRWSDTVFTNRMLVVSRADTPPLPALDALAGRRVGTVLGYHYPELERKLGNKFVRDEAASDEQNLYKLLSGRFDFMLSNALSYDYQRKAHPQGGKLNAAVHVIRSFDTYCALPPKGKMSLKQVNRAIHALRMRGTMQSILAHYRPAS